MQKRARPVLALLAVTLLLVLAGSGLSRGDDEVRCGELGPMPELPSREQGHWIGTEPLTRADLDGRVVMLNVWTFG